MMFASFQLAATTAVFAALSSGSATAIQLWFRVPMRRAMFRRRQVASRVSTIAEALSSIFWAGTAVLVAGDQYWIAVLPGALASVTLFVAWWLSPRGKPVVIPDEIADASPQMRRHIPELRHQRRDLSVRIFHNAGTSSRRIKPQPLARPIGFPGRIGRRHQLAAAIGTDIVQPIVRAIGAPRAFVRADARVIGLRRQPTIANSQLGRSSSAGIATTSRVSNRLSIAATPAVWIRAVMLPISRR